MLEVGFGLGGGQGAVERHLGQLGHGLGDGLHGRAGLNVLHGQALHHELAGHAQRRSQVAATVLQPIDEGRDVGATRHPRAGLCKGFDLGGITAPDALDVAGVVGRGR